MTRPWQTLASAATPEGRLELRRRGEAEVVITVGGRVLMNSSAHRSEAALAELGCRTIAARPAPRVLLGGLGMGFTLRAALDALPRQAAVRVVEIDPVIVDWCRGPLAALTCRAVDDPRVRVEVADVAAVIDRAARQASARDAAVDAGFDAILLDLYEGPRTPAQDRNDPLYGRDALARARAALTPGGVFAVWSEDADAAFEKRLTAVGFGWERRRPGGGGPRHAVYLARLAPRGRRDHGTPRTPEWDQGAKPDGAGRPGGAGHRAGRGQGGDRSQRGDRRQRRG